MEKNRITVSNMVNPTKLVGEVLASIGASCHVAVTKAGTIVTVPKLPPGKTMADVAAVVAAHNPARVADPTVAHIGAWASLTPVQKDALLLAAVKHLYRVP